MIPQAKLGSNLQTEIPDRIPGLAAFVAVVGSPYRTVIELGTCPTQVAIEDRMEGTAGAVVAAEYPMVYRAMAHGAFSDKPLWVKVEKISAHYVVRQPAAVDGCDEFDVLFLYLQR